MYAQITHLDQVLNAIDDAKHCFTVKYRDGFVFVKYKDGFVNHAFPPITPSLSTQERIKYMIRRECRGIAFREKDGKLVIRRFHKFFNLNERPECNVEAIDFNRKFYCLEKADGTLISPLEYKGRIRFTSQLGFSQQSELADKLMAECATTHQYAAFSKYCIDNELTPCFEYISDKNRVVIKYEKSELILLAVRSNESGQYSSYDELIKWSKKYNIPLIPKWQDEKVPKGDGEALVKYVRDLKGIEGCVIIFEETQEMYKCKTISYSFAHSINPEKIRERQLWRAAVMNVIDDLASMIDFSLAIRTCVQQFRDDLQICIEKKVNSLLETAMKLAKLSPSAREDKIDDIADKYDQSLLKNILQIIDKAEKDIDEDAMVDIILEQTEAFILTLVEGPPNVFSSSRNHLYKWLDFSLKCIKPYYFEAVSGIMKLPSSAASTLPSDNTSSSSPQPQLDESYSRLNKKISASNGKKKANKKSKKNSKRK